MTLQDKQMGLLADGDTADDVVDIFDQYGGNQTSTSTSTTSATPQNVTRPATDDDLDTEQDTEKKWEQEIEDESMTDAQIPKTKPVMQQPQVAPIKQNATEPVTQAEKIAYVQEMKKTSAQENDAIKVVAPPTMDGGKKEVQNINDLQENIEAQSEDINTTKPQTQQEKKFDTIETQQTQKSPTKPYIQAHAESVHSATAATKETAQMVKKSYAPKTDKEIKVKDVHVDPSKKTILIADDDVDTMEMYAEIFEQANYNVLKAADGLEAMSLVSEHTPHIIFTGIVMPRMDGFSLMEALKENKRTADIPVVINSHLGREEDKKRAEELGARDFIVRGFTPPREALERVGAMLLRSEYIFRFDKTDLDARKLSRDLGMPNFFRCPRGQDMVLKLSITDEKELTFSARFSCMDKKK